MLGMIRRALPLLALLAWSNAQAEELVMLPTRPGVTQPIHVTRPAGAPTASLVLFPGGDGRIKPYRQPPDLGLGNFLVRTRDLFAAQGFLVAVFDVPSDQASGMEVFRLSPEHATDIAAVVAWLKAAAPAPVWLVGTSRGTISATLGAASIPGIHGLVLTSTVTRPAKQNPSTVFNIDLTRIAVPTLVVNHRDDGCYVAVPADAQRLVDALVHAPVKEALVYDGGTPARSEPCEPLAPHGYYGIEPMVVAGISDWIRRH
jgi:pimeloyl-ACP methyl ester carboxylesterase